MTDDRPSPDRKPLPGRGALAGNKPESDVEENRTLSNIVLAIGFLVLIGSGIWLADAMLDARRADDCLSSGRRNCSPVPVVPAR